MTPETAELRRARPLLGTLVEITARGPDAGRLALAVEAGFAAIAVVERRMSFHDGRSDVTRMNRHATCSAVRVHPWTFAVLQRALSVGRASSGLFDVTVASVLVKSGLLPAVRGAPVPCRAGRFHDIRLLPGFRVRFARPLLLDLGGIAKGFAVDRAIDRLRAAGASSAVVNAGGDLRCFGAQPQRVYVRDPASPGSLFALAELRSGALATSGAYFSTMRRAGRLVSAFVHRRRPRFVPSGSVSVAAKDCVTADAWTKVLLLSGRRFLGRARRAGVAVKVTDAIEADRGVAACG